MLIRSRKSHCHRNTLDRFYLFLFFLFVAFFRLAFDSNFLFLSLSSYFPILCAQIASFVNEIFHWPNHLLCGVLFHLTFIRCCCFSSSSSTARKCDVFVHTKRATEIEVLMIGAALTQRTRYTEKETKY